MKRRIDFLTLLVLFIIALIVTGFFFLAFCYLPQVEAFEYVITVCIVLFLLYVFSTNQEKK